MDLEMKIALGINQDSRYVNRKMTNQSIVDAIEMIRTSGRYIFQM